MNSLDKYDRGIPAVITCGGSRQSAVSAAVGIIPSPGEFCRWKVISIRRQLRQGTYDLDKRLPAVVEKVLHELRK